MLPASVEKTEPAPGYPVYEIKNPHASAKIAQNGATLFDWTPEGHEPVLYTSPDAIFEAGKAIRGGVPICWPWFGAHSADPNLPQHGIARIQDWDLEFAADSSAGTELTFRLPGFELRAKFSIGADLDVELTTENPSDEAFPITEALHTYLRVGDIEQVSLTGFEGADYLDTLTDTNVSEKDETVRFSSETDRIYESPSAVTLLDPVLNRELLIEKTGSVQTVVWNPWVAKSQRLADLPDDGYREFVCIEAANAREGSCVIQPGESHTISTRICLLDS